MRAFIGIPLPKEFIERVSELQRELKDDPCLKLVPRENLHITLKFLGEVDDIGEWVERLETVSAKATATLEGVGAFPSEDYVRVVWVGVEGLGGIANKLGERSFKGHLTIARARCKPKSLKSFLEKHREERLGSFEVSKICIYESILQRPHPKYVEKACKLLERF